MIKVVLDKTSREPTGIFILVDQFHELKTGLNHSNPIFKAMTRVESKRSIIDLPKEALNQRLAPAFDEIKGRRANTAKE